MSAYRNVQGQPRVLPHTRIARMLDTKISKTILPNLMYP